MTDPDLQDQIAAATAYESLHVASLFEEWAEPVLDAALVVSGQRVLDVACGTGVLARTASQRVGPEGAVTGLDPSPGMLAVAEQINTAVEWKQGTAESLPFADASLDAVVSQFGLMFFADRTQAIREMIRVLVPGGRLAVAVWDSLDNTPSYSLEVGLLQRVAGQQAADALRAPFVLGDRGELAALFERSGAASVEIATHMGTGRFPSIRTMVEADLRGWLPVMGVELTEDTIELVLAEAEGVLAGFVVANGKVVFDSPAHIVTCCKPTDSGGESTPE